MQSMQITPSALSLSHGDSTLNRDSAAPTLRFQLEGHLSNGVAIKEKWKPPPSAWTSKSHRDTEDVAHEVDQYFLRNWDFPNSKSEQTFLKAGFSKVTSLYFPTAKDDRIQYACRLLTVLFLVDDLLEEMSLEEGEAFNEKLIPIMHGHIQPNRSNPVEYILYDLWEEMRLIDEPLANTVLEPTFIFMKAQTDKARLSITKLGQYFEYREKDVGKALLSSLMCFTLDLHLTPEESASMEILERYCARHISIVNDIMSWEKEVKAAQSGHHEGSVLCSAVKVLADETSLEPEAAKRILWYIARELERYFDGIVMKSLAAPQGCSQMVKDYMRGLEHQMSGNETWSRTTLRYNDLK
ncbi:hypothetical protein MMC31_002299 [Peltigera leucophlebia]|nr:hypothetical protein [Peltigera leucophlebia]